MLRSITQRAGILCGVIVLFEIFLSRSLEIFAVRPDFFVMFIVFWAFIINRRTVPQLALGLGFIRDVFSTGFFGAETLSYFLLGCAVFMLSLKIDRVNPWIRGVSCFIFTLLHFWIYALITYIMDGRNIVFGSIFGLSILQSFYTAIISFWLIGFFEKILNFNRSRISINA